MGERCRRAVRLRLGDPGINEVIYAQCPCVLDPRYADGTDGQLDIQPPTKGASSDKATIEFLCRDVFFQFKIGA